MKDLIIQNSNDSDITTFSSQSVADFLGIPVSKLHQEVRIFLGKRFCAEELKSSLTGGVTIASFVRKNNSEVFNEMLMPKIRNKVKGVYDHPLLQGFSATKDKRNYITHMTMNNVLISCIASARNDDIALQLSIRANDLANRVENVYRILDYSILDRKQKQETVLTMNGVQRAECLNSLTSKQKNDWMAGVDLLSLNEDSLLAVSNRLIDQLKEGNKNLPQVTINDGPFALPSPYEDKIDDSEVFRRLTPKEMADFDEHKVRNVVNKMSDTEGKHLNDTSLLLGFSGTQDLWDSILYLDKFLKNGKWKNKPNYKKCNYPFHKQAYAKWERAGYFISKRVRYGNYKTFITKKGIAYICKRYFGVIL